MLQQRAHVLLAHGQPAELAALGVVLDHPELAVVRAASGEEALRQAEEHDFAVILLECRLPDSDGLEVTRRLTSEGRNALTPIILLAGEDAVPAGADAAYAAGAVDYLSGPLNPQELRAKVRAFARAWQRAAAREAAAQQQVHAALENIPEGFLALDYTGCCTFLNAAGERLLGCSRIEILERPACDVLPGGPDSPAGAEIRRALEERTAVELEYHHPSWNRWFDVRAVPSVEGGLSVYFRDVSSRKRAEEQLRRSQSDLMDFFENASEGLHWVGPDGTVLWANQAELDLLGYTREEYFGRPIQEFHADPHVIADILSRLINGQAVENYEARLRCRDGSIRHVLISSSVLRFEGQFIHTRCFTRDITERRRAEDALRAQGEALRAADRRKDEFLAMLAHELRNPLAPILTAVEIFRLRDTPDPLLRRQREVIHRQVMLMKRLLDDLLEVSRITRGKVQLGKERLNLSTVLTNAVETSQSLIQEREHTLEVALPDTPLEVDADPARLSQVFTNLLNNAARYTEPGGKIWLTAERSSHWARIRVRDTGIGMSPEVVDRAFELFAQGERSLDRSQGGLGIGLTLVRELVDMHGGEVSAYSAGPNQGSEFVVLLPLAKPEGDQTPAAGIGEGAPADAERQSASGNGCGVLVVDDNVDQADGMAMLLELEGYDVCVAYDGPSALELAEQHRPAVAILDIGLPGMDGYELARQLRARAGLPTMKLVALTGYGRAEDHTAAIESGFHHHLVKPLDIGELFEILSDRREEGP